MEAKENATEWPQIALSYNHNINDHISKECQYSLVTPSGLFGHSLRTRTVNFLPIRIQNIKLTIRSAWFRPVKRKWIEICAPERKN